MSSSKNLENEATTSAERMQTHAPTAKRRRSETNCHQCHRNDKEIVVACSKCKKNYCIPCVTKWYSTLGLSDVREACPGCRNICNCAACLKSCLANKNLPIPDLKLGKEEKVQYSKHIIRILLPYLKQFVASESIGREDEARIPELLVKAEAMTNVGILTDPLDTSKNECFCCAEAMVVMKDDQKHFQYHLQRGEPVIISDVLSGGTGLSWEPLVMWRACRKPGNPNQETKFFQVINCIYGNEEKIGIHEFFRGYLEGLFDTEGQLKNLRLKDWPPSESFEEQLPRHFVEYVRCLPFMPYTHPHGGLLNMSTRVPTASQRLDLGPKMSICCGADQELVSSSLTMVHYAPADKVDILMHSATICPALQQISRLEKLSKRNGQRCIDPSILRGRVEGHEEPAGGAEWDIFRRQDVSKLEEYLKKHAGELKPISLLQQSVHPIHDRAFYLNAEHKIKLKDEYGIVPWTFVQKVGDAIFVPAGCPRQIRHLKSCMSVALNFVAPESIGECIRLSDEYRCLPQNHECKEDKLQVKQMTLRAVEEAMQYLEADRNTSTSQQATPPPWHDRAQSCQPTLHDLQYMKNDMEGKVMKLQTEGHLLQPDTRAHLKKCIEDFLIRINVEMQKLVIGASTSRT